MIARLAAGVLALLALLLVIHFLRELAIGWAALMAIVCLAAAQVACTKGRLGL